MISVVTPAYEAHGNYQRFLTDLYRSLHVQNDPNWEWVVSDQSNTNAVQEFLESLKDKRIKYFKCGRGRGNASVNMNNGINNSASTRIKIMHMDDFFCNDRAINLLNQIFTFYPDLKWGAFTFNHFYEESLKTERVIKPSMDFTMGCPSTSFFIKDNNFFDENLIFINDHDMHQRLFKKYGEPYIIDELSITIRMHPSQVSRLVPEREKQEWEYFNQKIKTL